MMRLLCLSLFLTASARADDRDPANYSEDEKFVHEARVNPTAEGVIAFFKKRTLTDEQRKEMERLVVQLGDRSFKKREEASRRLEEWGPPALPFLTPAVRLNPDPEVVRRAERCVEAIQQGPGPALPRAAARVLVQRKPKEAVTVLLEYLPYADDETVTEEVLNGLTALGQDKSRLAPLLPAVRDSFAPRRAAAGYVLGRSPEKDHRAAVQKLLTDPDAAVRFRAAQGLLVGRERSAVPALIGLLDRENGDMVWEVEDLLARIAGEAAPPRTNDAWGDYRDRWSKWWKDHGDKIDLAKIEQDPPMRGWTAIAQMSTQKVYEVDRHGTVRWTIGTLNGPIDVQPLAGDRVLIAEHNGSKVTERNHKGEVLWEKALGDRPVSVQRLPNGNTFIVTYSYITEVTREGKEVYNYRPDNTAGRIYCGQKQRNGKIVCVTLEGRILELDGVNGKVLRNFETKLHGCYSVQALPGGNVLVASYNQGTAQELDPSGKVVWKHDLPNCYHAERLPNGHTLLSSHGQSKVIEVDRAGKVVWEQNTGGNSVWRVHRR